MQFGNTTPLRTGAQTDTAVEQTIQAPELTRLETEPTPLGEFDLPVPTR